MGVGVYDYGFMVVVFMDLLLACLLACLRFGLDFTSYRPRDVENDRI